MADFLDPQFVAAFVAVMTIMGGKIMEWRHRRRNNCAPAR